MNALERRLFKLEAQEIKINEGGDELPAKADSDSEEEIAFAEEGSSPKALRARLVILEQNKEVLELKISLLTDQSKRIGELEAEIVTLKQQIEILKESEKSLQKQLSDKEQEISFFKRSTPTSPTSYSYFFTRFF